MKIRIITCHNVYNYGAALQAVSLQRYLSRYSDDCRIIDYLPGYLTDRYRFSYIDSRFKKNVITKMVYFVAKLPGKIHFLRRQAKFARFNKSYLKTTPKVYHNVEQLREDDFSDTLIICGSDQIWNTSFCNGNDPAFFADFSNLAMKASYAASIALPTIPQEKKEWFQRELADFMAVSVREKSAKEALTELGIENVITCLDPVFLTDSNEWIEHFNLVKRNEKYLLVYVFELPEEQARHIIELSKQLNLPIYSVNSTKCKWAQKNYDISDPKDFLELVYSATYVVTNSFHGMAFSLLFQKKFIALSRNGLNSRLKDLLDDLELSDRMALEHFGYIENPIDYEKVMQKLNELKMCSTQYLEAVVQKAEENQCQN